MAIGFAQSTVNGEAHGFSSFTERTIDESHEAARLNS
jgi:hypothetical protein